MKMKKINFKNRKLLSLACAAGAFLFLVITDGQVVRAESIDPEADRILQSMSSFMGGTEAFHVKADIDFEVIATNGQKLQISSFATAAVKRPSNLHIEKKGMIADIAFIYDGNNLTLHGKNLNIYSQIEGTGTIDDAIRAYEMETGMVAPGADLLLSDPYAVLTDGVEESLYIGIASINGVKCHHLAFREAKVDWQLWVQVGNTPLPMKYVITSKWLTAAPQYEIRFRDWNTKPKFSENLFKFTVPDGAKRLEAIPVDEVGEFTSREEG